MIKYDYKIIRNEGDEVRHYSPKLLPQELNDLVYIQGPNSSGKSTLLNLIALGFFGEKLKEDELNQALREKILQLINSNHQELTFDIEIDNEVLGINLKSIKKNLKTKDFKVLQIIDGREKIISADEFTKEYKLIYDIPSNPIDRLPELLKEIKSSQELIEHEINRIKNKIIISIKEIKEGHDPSRLSELDNLVKDKTEKKEKLHIEIENEEKRLKWLKEFHSLKFYIEYSDAFKDINEKIKEAEKSITSVTKKKEKLSKKKDDLISKIKSNISDGRKLHQQAEQLLRILLPKTEKHRLEIWEDCDFAEAIRDKDIFNDLKSENKHFIIFFKNIQLEDKDEKASEASLLKELFELLSGFKNLDILVPGTGKKINEFLEILETERKAKEGIINRIENIDKVVGLLNNIQDLLEETIRYKENLSELRNDESDVFDWVKPETDNNLLEKLQEDRKIIERKKTFYEKELIKLDLNPSESKIRLRSLSADLLFEVYEKSTESQLFDVINNRHADILKKKENEVRLFKEIEIANEEIERIRKKKPHKYQKYLKELDEARLLIMQLESKFSNDFNDYIKKIMTKKDIPGKAFTKEELLYAEKIAVFLGAKVRFIKHIDSQHEICKIDVVNKEIITTTGKHIKFTDLGTGQGQGAYLEGLLNTNDSRKIIALFDEVAMMDTETLQPIFNKLNELYSQKKLLLGIIVQKSDDVKIISLLNK